MKFYTTSTLRKGTVYFLNTPTKRDKIGKWISVTDYYAREDAHGSGNLSISASAYIVPIVGAQAYPH